MTGQRHGRPWSVNSVRTYVRCPKQYWYHYLADIELEPTGPVPEHMRIGSVVHVALEAAFNAQRAARRAGTLSDTTEVAVAALRASWEEMQLPPHGGELDRVTGFLIEALEAYQVDGASILGVEYVFDLVTPEGTPFTGIADVLTQPGPATIEIVDHKVRSTPATPDALGRDFQLGSYGWAARQTWPWAETIFVAHHYPPIAKKVSVALTTAAMDEALDRLEAVVEMAEADNDFDPRPGEACSSCGYQVICPAWQNEDADLVAMREF